MFYFLANFYYYDKIIKLNGFIIVNNIVAFSTSITLVILGIMTSRHAKVMYSAISGEVISRRILVITWILAGSYELKALSPFIGKYFMQGIV